MQEGHKVQQLTWHNFIRLVEDLMAAMEAPAGSVARQRLFLHA
jgi:hypothetical protein